MLMTVAFDFHYQWRLVRNRRRAKKLRKRGEPICWSSENDCWAWLRMIVEPPAGREGVDGRKG